MYNCEKLARGSNGGFIKCGKAEIAQIVNLPASNSNMFCAVGEKDPNRPVGRLYVSKK